MKKGGFLRSLTVFASWTMMSRIFGLLRDIIIATTLGAGWRFDAFMIALRVPNTLRRLTAEGALHSAFVPTFTSEQTRHGAYEARVFFGQVMFGLSVLLGCISLFAVLWPMYVVDLFAPGLETTGPVRGLAIELTRIVFPYIALISATALFGGVLIANGRTAAFAATSVLFNICLIVAAAGAILLNHDVARALAWGVAISGLCQLGLVFYSAWKCQMTPIFWRSRKRQKTSASASLDLAENLSEERSATENPAGQEAPPLRVFFLALGPALLGASVSEINSIIDLMIASTLTTGSISILYLAERVMQLPLGLIGAALGLAILPLLSRKLATKDIAGAHQDLADGLTLSLILALPAAGGLIILALPIVQVLFQHGAFTAENSLQSARALQIFAICLPAAIMNKCLLAGFFAYKDTKRPAWVACLALMINASVSYSLSLQYGFIGVAIGTSLSIWSQTLALFGGLLYMKRMTVSRDFLASLLKIGLAVFVWGLVLAGTSQLFPMSESFGETLWSLTVLIGLAGGLWLGIAYKLGYMSLLIRMNRTSIT